MKFVLHKPCCQIPTELINGSNQVSGSQADGKHAFQIVPGVYAKGYERFRF